MGVNSIARYWGKDWIALVLAATLGIATDAAAQANAPTSLLFKLKQIAPAVYAAIDGPSGAAGSNAGFIIGDDSVLVVDSFFDPAAATALVAEIRKLTPKPIRYVVNTHYHVDHVAGDAVMKAAGAVIVAHTNVPSWVRTENLHLFGDSLSPQTRSMIETLTLPDVTTDQNLVIWLGKRKIVVRTVTGHTGGDLIVSVPDAKVVFCGDMLWNHVAPNTIDGNVAGWIGTINAMTIDVAAATSTFVPGHGDIATLNDVLVFQTYLTDLKTLVERKRADHLFGDTLVKAAMPEFAGKYHAWDAFNYFGPLELRHMDEELAGTKRTPLPNHD